VDVRWPVSVFQNRHSVWQRLQVNEAVHPPHRLPRRSRKFLLHGRIQRPKLRGRESLRASRRGSQGAEDRFLAPSCRAC